MHGNVKVEKNFMLNVVIINGGRGASSLIPALLARKGLNVTSIVNAYDDGKSTGEIRRFFGMVGPSDIRKVQQLMLPEDGTDYESNLKLFEFRFSRDCSRSKILNNMLAFSNGELPELMGLSFSNNNTLKALRIFVKEFLSGLHDVENVMNEKFIFDDCSLMNCIYAGAFLKFNRDFERATKFIDKLFKLQGTVLPTNADNKKLVALGENGEMLYSEAEIVELRSNVRIEGLFILDQPLEKTVFERLGIDEKRSYLTRHHSNVVISLDVKRALQQADIIIYAAGTQHSSLYPTYMSAGLATAISDNTASFKVFVTNIGADYETPNYTASDYIKGAYRYLNFSKSRNFNLEELFDVVFVNRSNLKADETYVVYDELGFADIPIKLVLDNFESTLELGKHDGSKVVDTIMNLFDDNNYLDTC